MKNILLIVIMFHIGFIVKAQSNNTPKLLYTDSISSTPTNSQKPVLLLEDSISTDVKQYKKSYEPKLAKTNIINNENDSILIKKKETEIEN